MKRPTKHQLESLPFTSVRGERYVRLDALTALLDELEQAEQAEAKDTKAEPTRADRKA